MSIFGKIMGAIFGGKADAAPSETPGPNPSTGHSTPGTAPSDGTKSATGTGIPSSGNAAAPSKENPVEVAPILDAAVKSKGEKLEWRTSIVDLMKALDIDSSLSARKELATELKYTGDMNDSATMNVWLHKEVVSKLAANGGKLPDDMKQ